MKIVQGEWSFFSMKERRKEGRKEGRNDGKKERRQKGKKRLNIIIYSKVEYSTQMLRN